MALTSAFVKSPAPNRPLASMASGRGAPALQGRGPAAASDGRVEGLPRSLGLWRAAMRGVVRPACGRVSDAVSWGHQRERVTGVARPERDGARGPLFRKLARWPQQADRHKREAELSSAKRAARRPSPSLAAAKPCWALGRASQRGPGSGWRVDGIALTWSDRSHQGGPREAIAAPGERTRQTA